MRAPKVFESRSVVEIHKAEIFSEAGAGRIIQLNGLRKRYAALARTLPITGPAATALHVKPGVISRAASVAVTADSLIMYPMARAGSAKEAQRIAQALTTSLVDFSKQEQTADGIPAEKQVQLRVVQAARPGLKTSPKTSHAWTVATFTGVVALAGAYVLLQLITVGRRLP
jgi:hypothetical protein